MNIKCQIQLLLCLLFSLNSLYGQSSINGLVKNKMGESLQNVQVILAKSLDSQLINNSLTNSRGYYEFKNVQPGRYLIITTFLGYERYISKELIIEKSTNQIHDVTLIPKNGRIQEVVVKANKPLLEQKADRLIVNVANSPIAMGATALEVLRKVPGVVIVQDNVTLAGNKSVQIWIEGKPSTYTDINALLRDMPGDQIEKIEVIRQPGAQFDASGGSILNIVMKRNARLGFNGTAQLSLSGIQVNQNEVGHGIKDYSRLSPSFSLNYRVNRWNLYGNASLSNAEDFDALIIARKINSNEFISNTLNESKSKGYNIRAGVDYFASRKTTVGFLFKTFNNVRRINSLNLTDNYDLTTQSYLTSFHTDNISERSNQNYTYNVNLKHLFDTLKEHSLNIDMDYIQYHLTENDQFYIYPSTAPQDLSLSSQNITQPVHLWVFKADYEYPFDSMTKISLGAKSSLAKIDNQIDFYRGTQNSNTSNYFLYDENISAAYLNLNKNWKKFELNLGLRAENTKAIGSSQGIETLNRNYLQWFPSASLLYKLNEHLGIQMAYSKRVYRPSFNEQNPFRRYIDSLTYQSGNPNLRPEIMHTGEIGLVYEGQPFIQAEYSVTDDVIIENAPQLDGNTTFTMAQNLAKHYNWTFQVNFPIKFGKLVDGYGGNQLIYNAYKAEYLGSIYNDSRWHWLAYFDINFTLAKEYKIEFSGFYTTKFLEEFLTIGAISGFDIGISKTIWEKRGKLSFTFTDILYGQKVNADINYNNIQASFYQKRLSQNLKLSFSYNFGNLSNKKQRSRNTAADTESQRVKVDTK